MVQRGPFCREGQGSIASSTGKVVCGGFPVHRWREATQESGGAAQGQRDDGKKWEARGGLRVSPVHDNLTTARNRLLPLPLSLLRPERDSLTLLWSAPYSLPV